MNLIQNLRFYYENASLINKQKLIGSIFPENLIIENGECRTARENEVILALKGFEADFKTENPTAKSGFPILYPQWSESRTKFVEDLKLLYRLSSVILAIPSNQKYP